MTKIIKITKIRNVESGSALVYTVVVAFILSMVMLGALSYATINLRVIRSSVNRELAFHIAEAGVNYYQWHLAHYTTDYFDGNASSTSPGPYLHDFIDKDTGQKVGEFSLQITPPPLGSTIVTIQSTGYTVDHPATKRIITARYGVPSLAKYGFITNSYVSVGSGTSFYGPFHSNSGIQFNGTANAPITSSRTTYTCQAGDGCSGTHSAIWGTAPLSTQAFWQISVPDVNYASISSDLSDIEDDASTGGKYLAPSGAGNYGYSLVFLNNGTYRVYKVTSLSSHATGYDSAGASHSEDINYNNRSQQSTICNPYPCQMPANGLIFVEDRVWVEGVVNGRVTVAASKFTTDVSQKANILIPNNITYLAKDGSHVLGLIAEKDILLTHNVPDDLEINAAFIAQSGSFQRYCFPGSVKDTLTVYGSISSFGRAAVYSGCQSQLSGFPTRSYTYDPNLLYGPPPSFPLSSEGYQQISWTSN